MGAMIPDRPHYPNWDILRCLLAFGVVVQHSYFADRGIVAFPYVPAFVCLSGMLIPASLKASKTWVQFARKRALRIVPAMLASFVLVAALLGRKALTASVMIYLTAGMSIIHTGSIRANGPLWSLMVEEILYGFHAMTRRALARQLFVGLLAAACIGGWGVWRYQAQPRYFLDFVPADMFCSTFASFLVGNLLYMNERWVTARSWLWPAALLIVALTGCFELPHGVAPCVLVPCVAASTVVLARTLPQAVRIPDISYGVYVYHFPIMLKLYARGFRDEHLVMATVGITAATALVSWYALEKRALRWKTARAST